MRHFTQQWFYEDLQQSKSVTMQKKKVLRIFSMWQFKYEWFNKDLQCNILNKNYFIFNFNLHMDHFTYG